MTTLQAFFTSVVAGVCVFNNIVLRVMHVLCHAWITLIDHAGWFTVQTTLQEMRRGLRVNNAMVYLSC